MFIANKKLRSLRSLRHSLVFIANKTPLAWLAPSKFVSLLLKTPLASLAPSKPFCVANNFSPRLLLPISMMTWALAALCRHKRITRWECYVAFLVAYTWVMLAAYATCDDYPHNAYPGRFLNFKIYLLFGVHAGIICWCKITDLHYNLDKSSVVHWKLHDFNDNLWKSLVFKRKSKIWTRIFRKSLVFQRKTDIGEEPKRKKTQTEEPQVR